MYRKCDVLALYDFVVVCAAGFVTKPPEQPQEFQMHHEDFPALPGATHANQSTGRMMCVRK